MPEIADPKLASPLQSLTPINNVSVRFIVKDMLMVPMVTA